MNKLYIIIPLLLTLGFVGYYWKFNQEYKEKERIELREKEEKAAAAAAAKKEREEEAAREAKRKAEERAAAEKAKEDERKRKQEAADKAVKDEFEELTAKGDEVNKQRGELESKLIDLRRKKENMQKQALELAKEVEMLEIQRRNAEIELQRVTEMMANRVGGSALVQAPLFLNPAEKQKSSKDR